MKKLHTRKLTLPETTDTALLYGSFDCHLKTVERAFSVRLSARGNQITLEGEAKAALLAEEALLHLAAQLYERGEITPQEVEQIICAPQRPQGAPVSEAAHILVSGKRGEITSRSEAQKNYVEKIQKSDIVVAIGPAGTGKTYLAMAMAVSLFLKREVNRIIFTRPAVEAGERLGFLPGDMVEKVSPYLRPLYDALYDMMEVERAKQLLERGDIEIAPLAFMRGRTLHDAFIILDEAQNTTPEQMKMFLTRLGSHSKMVISGDITQCDLPATHASGLAQIEIILSDLPGIQFIHFTERDVVRHKLVQEIVKAYERYEANMKKSPRRLK